MFSQIAVFFSKMAMVTFGGAYAVLAYVAQQAVETYGWLQPGEMLDGLGMAETTPGPLIMVLQFVGFMAAYREPGALSPLLGRNARRPARHLGDVHAVLPVDFSRRAVHRTAARQQRPGGALSAITAAVVGVVLNLAIWFAIHTIFREVRPVRWGPFGFDAPVLSSVELWALLLSAAAVVAMFRFKAGMVMTLAATSAAGVILYLAGAIG